MNRRQLLFLAIMLFPLYAFSPFDSAEELREVTATGILRRNESGGYFLTAGAGRSRASYRIVQEDTAAYESLAAYIGEEITITGEEVERKSAWNITIRVLSVSLAKTQVLPSMQKAQDTL